MGSGRLLKNQNGSALFIVLALVTIAVIGGVVAYVFTSQSKTRNNSSIAGTSQQQASKASFKETTATNAADIKALLAAAKTGSYDAKCTFTDDSGKSAAIFVTSADKMRIDSTINNKPGHLLRLANTAYVWADGDPEGSILPVTSNGTSATDKYAENIDKYKLVCKSAERLDSKLFDKPSGVNFVDVNSKLKSSYSSTN